MLYFAVADGGLDAGACVTASHNPPQYTGLKMVTARARCRCRATRASPRWAGSRPHGPPVADAPGARERDDTLLERYIDQAACRFIDPAKVRDLRVVIDAANGMGGLFMPPVLDRLAIHAVPYYLDLDGTFPNHEPNPLLPENRQFIMAKVREEGADLGIAFDGDADRCFFIDDAGEFVAGDFLTALLATHLLERTGPAPVV